MPVTTPGAYLILARYNREKWNGLKKPAAKEVGSASDQAHMDHTATEQSLTGEQEQAHKRAERLFPENYYPLPQLTPEERKRLPPLISEQHQQPPDLKGVRMLHSFHTNMFARLHEKIPDIEEEGEDAAATTPAEGGTMPEKTTSEILDEIFTAPDTGEKDPGIGWLAVVDAGDFQAFVDKMGSRAGPLWRMYDIEVFPLNNDQTTLDIYEMMTPVHWG